MAVHYRTRGSFLKKSAKGEADELFIVYAKDFGKLKILGKAIRKIASKLRGGAELFYLSDIEFIQGRSHKTLTDAVLITNFKNIRQNLGGLRVVYKIAELLDDLAAKEEKDEQVWELLNEVFHKLDNPKLSINGCQLLYYYFFWNLISLLGYKPEINNCSIQGNVVDCDIIRILRVIFQKDWKILSRLKLETAHLKLLKDISEWYNDNVVKTD